MRDDLYREIGRILWPGLTDKEQARLLLGDVADWLDRLQAADSCETHVSWLEPSDITGGDPT
jgi:hypothetical protein